MDNLLTKDKVKTILQNAPKGSDQGRIIQALVDKGYKLEGYNDQPTQPVEQKKPGLIDKVATDINERVDKTGQILNRKDTGVVEKTTQMLGNGAGMAANILEQVVNEVPGVAKTFEKMGEGIKWLSESDSSPIKKLGDVFGGSKTLQEVVKLYDTDPNFKDTIDGVSNLVRLGGDVDAAVSSANFAKNVTNKISTTLESTDAGKMIKDALPKVVEAPLVKAGETLKTAGTKLYDVGVQQTERTKMAVQSYEASKPTLIERVGGLLGKDTRTTGMKPITESESAARNGLVGTEKQLGVQAVRVSRDLWDKTIAPALKLSGNKTDMVKFIGDLKNEIIANNPVGIRQNQLLDSLKAFAKPLEKLGTISDEQLQVFKEDWTKLLPDASYKGKTIASTLKEVQQMASDNARSILRKSLGGEVGTAYIDYGNMKSIAELGRKTQDMLRSKGMSKQVWEAVLDTTIVPVTTIAGQVLYKTGEGLEFLGKAGGRTVRDIIGVSEKAAPVTEKAKGIIKEKPLVSPKNRKPGTLQKEMKAREAAALKSTVVKDTPSTQVKVKTTEKGHMMNIGMNVNGGKSLTASEIKNAIKESGAKILKSSIKKSGTEPTFIVKLSKPLDANQMNKLAEVLKQEAIPQLSNGIGNMYGPKAAKWGAFNPYYFMNFNGKSIGKLATATVKK